MCAGAPGPIMTVDLPELFQDMLPEVNEKTREKKRLRQLANSAIRHGAR
jgi:hypothetical protein